MYTSNFLERVLGERVEQVAIKGFTPQHDDLHTDEELHRYVVYLLTGDEQYFPKGWHVRYKIKESDTKLKLLVKATAVLIAEGERVERLGWE